jgi:O-acetyl-ADP-ribose deacetylase (regulator of RNase III)
MIEFTKGNLFDSGCEALVCPTNCRGVMGKGIALQFKNRYPIYFKTYWNCCMNDYIQLGKVMLFKDFATPYIFSLPTKYHWTEKSQIIFIQSGLKDLAFRLKNSALKSVAIPALGCGEGHLDWNMVKPLFEYYLGGLKDRRILIYEPLEQ